MGTVLVLGSINADLVVRTSRRPGPGETVLADEVAETCGGKGANQAVAAARAGADVALVGAVGDDDRGQVQLAALRAEGVNVDGVLVVAGVPTGLAVITVTPDGENAIVVVPGANAHVRAAGTAEVVVAQTEIPAAVVDSAVPRTRFVLNTAPVVDLAPATLAAADPLVVNAGEADELARRLGGVAADLRELTGAVSVVVTLGADGARVLADGLDEFVRAPRTDPVDTTGAGDVLVGTLAAALAGGGDLAGAVRIAVAAAADSITRRGAR